MTARVAFARTFIATRRQGVLKMGFLLRLLLTVLKPESTQCDCCTKCDTCPDSR